MVSYAVSSGAGEVFDPAVGEGAFFRAANVISREIGRALKLSGAELDPEVLQRAEEKGLPRSDFRHVRVRDFVLDPPCGSFKAIVANPPYIRHHRMPAVYKDKLRRFAANLVGKSIDGRAGFHVYFLLRALQMLANGGCLAFIMPADTCEGVFSQNLWNWITAHYRLEVVVAFDSCASPFPGVDTNPLIFMIKAAAPKPNFWWVRCRQPETAALKSFIQSGFVPRDDSALSTHSRTLVEGLTTGLSRPPAAPSGGTLTLGDFARVMRGIATGTNDFFFLTKNRAIELGIPGEFLISAVGRTRDVATDELTLNHLADLENKGRPTLLLSLDGRKLDHFPRTIRSYLQEGEARGLQNKALIRTRQPWYRMERRSIPPILFAYLGRRNARFIRNTAGVLPLTGFLCIYPLEKDPEFVEKLFKVLQHPSTIANLSLVGKSYGSGAIKVEPRALERLPLLQSVVSESGLHACARKNQMGLFPPEREEKAQQVGA